MSRPVRESTPDAAIGYSGYGVGQLQRRPPSGATYEIKLAGDDETWDGSVPFVWEIPRSVNGLGLVAVRAYYTTVGSGDTEIAFTNLNGSVAMLATNITIDSGEKSSRTAATPAVIAAAPDSQVVDGDQIEVTAPTPSDGLGLGIVLDFA